LKRKKIDSGHNTEARCLFKFGGRGVKGEASGRKKMRRMHSEVFRVMPGDTIGWGGNIRGAGER